MRRIVGDADVAPSDHVLEIGPGLGSMTKVLADSAEKVVAVELDNRLMPVLRLQLADMPHVELIHGDILKQNPTALFDRPYKVVANVPYYITGAILRHLLSAENKPQTLVITVQKEVAERMTAKPKNMSLLAVSVQFYGTVRMMRNIGAGAFYPRPKIASSVVRIDLNADQVNAVDEKLFFQIAKAGFSQKRKQLKNNLRALGFLDRDLIASALDEANVVGTRRAETLTVAEWIALTQTIQTKRA